MMGATHEGHSSGRSRRGDGRCGAAWCAALLAAGLILVATLPLGAADRGAGKTFRFASLNRSYSMDGADIAPVRQGPITVHLSSPRNVLVVKKNRLELEPLGDGSYRSRVSIDLLGSGDLIAQFDTGNGAGSPMEDRVVLPPQTIDLEGRVRFHRTPSGWEVTALSLPDETEVTIQSRVVNTLVGACDQLAVFLGLECGGLRTSLTHLAVPLPEPGTVFLLQEADLTPEEVGLLDGYLGTVDPGGAGIP